MCAAVGTPLLLPDRYGFFDSIDGFSASVECIVAMRGADRYANRDVTDVELPDAVNGRDPDPWVLSSDAFEHTRHLFFRETLVRLVV